MTAKHRRGADGIPTVQDATTAVTAAIQASGFEWEAQVVNLPRLAGKVRMSVDALGEDKDKRNLDFRSTLRELHDAKPGEYIFQTSLIAPSGFYARFGLDRSILPMSESHPDLLFIDEVKGRRVVRVIDIKRAESAKAVHRIQVLLYAWLLQDIVKEEGIDIDVDVNDGGVWLGGHEECTNLDLRPVRPSLERFMRDLPRLAAQPAGDVFWHLQFRCEACKYFDHCRSAARVSKSTSLLPGLSVFGKRFLDRQNVSTLPQLVGWLDTPEHEEVLATSASLAGSSSRLRAQAQSLLQNLAIPLEVIDPGLPVNESVRVVLTAQQEPLHDVIYLLGAHVTASHSVMTKLGVEDGVPRVFIAASPAGAPDAADAFVLWLHGILDRITEYNETVGTHAGLSVQCYVHDRKERVALEAALVSALGRPAVREASLALLLHFASPELAAAREHLDEIRPFPLVDLAAAQSRLIALPVDVSASLPEALAALGSDYVYARDPEWHFPLGPGLRPEGIHKVWAGTADTDSVEQRGRALLVATSELLKALRVRVTGSLFSRPPGFSMPWATGFQRPLLAGLSFFKRYESVLACDDVRGMRAASEDAQVHAGVLVELVAVDEVRFDVVRIDPSIDHEDTAWILVPGTQEGRNTQLKFGDYDMRRERCRPRSKGPFALAGIKSLAPMAPALPESLTLDVPQKFAGKVHPKKGVRYLLHRRFTDYTVDRIMDALRDIDAADPTGIVDFLEAPVSTARSLPDDVEAGVRTALPSLNLRPSQQAAFEGFLSYAECAVQGPPGTGKTFLISKMIALFVEAHRAAGEPFRVLVTACTHPAIENLLREVGKAVESASPPKKVAIKKVNGWRNGTPEAGVTTTPDKSIGAVLIKHEHLVLGATVHACQKKHPGAQFDLIVIDEASQMLTPDAMIALSLRRPGGRLVLAGDTLQLPPIVKGEWEPPPDGVAVDASILSCLWKSDRPGLNLQLHENGRMNRALTSLAARFIYGDDYRCATAHVAGRTLVWQGPADPDEFCDFVLSPDYPLTLVLVDDIEPGKVNIREARIVAQLTAALCVGTLDDKGRPYDGGNLAPFFHGQDGSEPALFIISPHHAQIAAIRESCANVGIADPFVDTVEKMQGQQAETVFVSYGVADVEQALQEAAFIYSRNRLNVSITRARRKVVLFLPRPLLEPPPAMLDIEGALDGIVLMRELYEVCCEQAPERTFTVDGGRVDVLRYKV